MPFIPCGFGGNWLLWRHSPAAFLPSKSPSSSGTYETSTRQTDRMLHGDLRVKCFFFFLRPMITVLQAPAHHTAWANDDAAMHVDGGWDISVLCFWLPNIAFISVFLLYRTLMYHDIILSWNCHAFHSVQKTAFRLEDVGNGPFGSALLQDWHLITYHHFVQAESDKSHHISTGAVEKTVNWGGCCIWAE